jgi:hypothetical protein
MKNFLAIFFLFIAASSYALEIVTLDGKAFHDCEVKKVEREGVRIIHRDGTAYLDFDVLPSALQKQYGWTPEKSAARKAARDAAAEVKRKASEEARIAAQEAQERAAALEKLSAENAAAAKRNQEKQKEAAIAAANAKIRTEKEAEERTATLALYGVRAVFVFLFAIPVIMLRGTRHIWILSGLGILGLLPVFYGAFSGVFGMLAFQYVYGWLVKDFRVPVVIVQQPPQSPQASPQPRVVAQAVPRAASPTSLAATSAAKSLKQKN